MMARFGYEGPVSVEASLSGILGVRWLHSPDGMGIYRGPASELDDAFSFSVPTTTEFLRERRDALVRDLLESILFGINGADYAIGTGHLEQLLRSGYTYNFCGNPAKLQL